MKLKNETERNGNRNGIKRNQTKPNRKEKKNQQKMLNGIQWNVTKRNGTEQTNYSLMK